MEYGATVPMENKIYCPGTTISISPCNNHYGTTEVRRYGGTEVREKMMFMKDKKKNPNLRAERE
jgi:hypothetical protein